MVKIIWTRRAFKDLEIIFNYIANDSELYATRQIDKIILTVDHLEQFPLSGRLVPEKNDETIRELIEGNYRIFYKIISTTRISILRVHHSAMNIK
jgi:toxin ParE1/3/4